MIRLEFDSYGSSFESYNGIKLGNIGTQSIKVIAASVGYVK